MRIAHLSDIHIRNFKYHREYRKVFEELFVSLGNNDVDVVVVTGDIAHSKTQISPEFVELCSFFLKGLADVCPTYLILGNHDGNLKNSFRQDSITPIVTTLQHKNLHLMKDSCCVDLDDGFSLYSLSIFDSDGWLTPKDKSKVNLAMYHGQVGKCLTDTGWKIHGKEDNLFDQYDYTFLGDIHKRQFVSKRKAYPGSLIQQNFGEEVEKGYLIWDIEDKDRFTTEFVALTNPKPFITIGVDENLIVEELNIPKGVRARLVFKQNLPVDILNKKVGEIKSIIKPESVSFLNLVDDKENTKRLKKLESYSDEATQKELIKDQENSSFRYLPIKDWHVRHKIMNNNEVEEIYQAFFKKAGW